MESNISIFTNKNEIGIAKTLLESLIISISIISILIVSFLSFLFSRNKSLFNNSVNYFIINLISIDVLKSVINIPLIVYSLEMISNGLSSQNDLERNMICNTQAFLTALFETIQLLSFTAVSFERFRMVKSPLLASIVRIKLTRKLLLVTWSLSLTLVSFLYLTISVESNFENFSNQNNRCFVDFFHIFIFHSNNLKIDQAKAVIKLNLIQNVIFDAYNLSITVVCTILSSLFYIKISIFLKNHKLEMEAKFHLNENKNQSAPTITLEMSVLKIEHKKKIKVYDYNGTLVERENSVKNAEGELSEIYLNIFSLYLI